MIKTIRHEIGHTVGFFRIATAGALVTVLLATACGTGASQESTAPPAVAPSLSVAPTSTVVPTSSSAPLTSPSPTSDTGDAGGPPLIRLAGSSQVQAEALLLLRRTIGATPFYTDADRHVRADDLGRLQTRADSSSAGRVVQATVIEEPQALSGETGDASTSTASAILVEVSFEQLEYKAARTSAPTSFRIGVGIFAPERRDEGRREAETLAAAVPIGSIFIGFFAEGDDGSRRINFLELQGLLFFAANGEVVSLEPTHTAIERAMRGFKAPSSLERCTTRTAQRCSRRRR